MAEINVLQKKVMEFITYWVDTYKTSIPQREVILHMQQQEVPDATTVNALHSLLRKGYIQRSCISSNKTLYIQLRKI